MAQVDRALDDQTLIARVHQVALRSVGSSSKKLPEQCNRKNKLTSQTNIAERRTWDAVRAAAPKCTLTAIAKAFEPPKQFTMPGLPTVEQYPSDLSLVIAAFGVETSTTVPIFPPFRESAMLLDGQILIQGQATDSYGGLFSFLADGTDSAMLCILLTSSEQIHHGALSSETGMSLPSQQNLSSP